MTWRPWWRTCGPWPTRSRENDVEPVLMTTAAGHDDRTAGRLLFLCCITGFACFFGSYLRIPVLPLLAASRGATAAQVGIINASFMLTAGLLAIPAGLLSDRLGRRPLLLGGLLVISCSSFLIPLSPGPLIMAAVYLLFGAGLSAFAPTMMSLVADITPRGRLGRAYSLYTAAVYTGMTFGPAAGGLLGRTIGLDRVFYVSGGLIMGALLFVLAFLPKTPPPSGEHRFSLRAALATLPGNRRLMACLLGTLGGCFGFGMFISFLPLHGRAVGLDSGHVGIVFACQALANALLRIPLGALSDRVDRGAMAAAGLFLFAAALATVGLCRGFIPLSLCAVVMGGGMGSGFTALGALVAEVVGPEQRGVALGLYNSCIYLGMMLSSATMGYVIHGVGYGNGFLAAGALVAGMTLLFSYRYRKAAAGG